LVICIPNQSADCGFKILIFLFREIKKGLTNQTFFVGVR
jgi:hypothetical protein